MSALQDQATELKNKAAAFYHNHVEAYLKPYGEIDLLGSYALDLMVWPDLDLQMTLKDGLDKAEICGELSKKLLRDLDVRHVKLIHFTPRKQSPFGLGMYLGIQFYPIDNLKWKVDLWMKGEEDRQKTISLTREIQQSLNPVNRDLILKWKHRLLNSDGRMPKLASFYLYQAILVHKLQKADEITQYLQQNGVVI